MEELRGLGLPPHPDYHKAKRIFGSIDTAECKDEFEFGENGQLILHSAKGCDVCNGTGYKGRVGLHELLIGSDHIKRLIQEHARVAQMLATALDEGMRTLKQDGIEKVLMGITDIQQVRAVCIK